jgi:hypothetical protein
VYRTPAATPGIREIVLQRATSWDRVGASVFAVVCLASAIACAIGLPTFGCMFSAAFGAPGLLSSIVAVRAWSGRVVTLIADRDARELRCIDGLHRWSPRHTTRFPLESIFTIAATPIQAGTDEGPPFAVQVRDGTPRGADLARFNDEAEAARVARTALELLEWLRSESGVSVHD